MLVKINTEKKKLGLCTPEQAAQILGYTYIGCGENVCMIDNEDAKRIKPYKWHLYKTRFNLYAYRYKTTNGKRFKVWMHRQIMHCPNDMIVHHKFFNGLDNRKKYLEIVTEKHHHLIHGRTFF